MSVEATVWARAQSGKIKTTAARLVLWAICFRADRMGVLTVPMTKIAEDTGLDISNVWKRVKELQSAQFLRKTEDGWKANVDINTMAQLPAHHGTVATVPESSPWHTCQSTMAQLPQNRGTCASTYKDKTSEDRQTDCLSDFSSYGEQPETSPPAAPAQRVCNEMEAQAPSCQPTTAKRVARRLAELYAGPLGSSCQHMETAQALVNSNMDLFGERKVLAAIASMERARANGKRFQSLWSAFASYCEKVATPKTEEEQEKEESLAEYRRQLAIIAGPSAEYAYARPAE